MTLYFLVKYLHVRGAIARVALLTLDDQ